MAQKVDRREKLIHSALELYLQNGQNGFRLNDVAKKAKVPAPLIHYYFNDVDDLFLAVVRVLLNEIAANSVSLSEKHLNDPLRRLREYSKGTVAWAFKNPQKMSLWLAFYAAAARGGEFEKLNSEIRERGRERIAFMIYECIEKKLIKLPQGKNVRACSFDVQSFLTGFAVMVSTERKTLSWDEITKQIDFGLNLILGTEIDLES